MEGKSRVPFCARAHPVDRRLGQNSTISEDSRAIARKAIQLLQASSSIYLSDFFAANCNIRRPKVVVRDKTDSQSQRVLRHGDRNGLRPVVQPAGEGGHYRVT